jgi:hypothetical protein
MDIDLTPFLQKVRGLSSIDFAMALPAVLRDSETGQINWNHVITGGLTTCVIAAGTSLISLNNKVSELTVLAAQRSQYIEQIPAALERLKAQEKAMDSLMAGNVAATSDRFRASDANRMEARLETRFLQELTKLENRIDRESGRGKR